MSDSGSGGRGFESRRDHKEVEAQNLAPLPLCVSPTIGITSHAGGVARNPNNVDHSHRGSGANNPAG
jgi:hypothetical protein